ncbi:metalloendopeptidase [Terrihabitans soli]|uniref:Metalloendopeptidase n=2 Tax=Terrihabitans soli TaxID=708113 RepID=A0A6S6QPU3_9HYPH|nr:metalloendopeptidase [Terrihabitans soli]
MLAVFYDGASNRKHRVELQAGEKLDIVEDGVVLDAWVFQDIRRVDGDMALRLTSISAPPLARIDIDDAATAERLNALLPKTEHLQEKRQTVRIIGWSLAAIASIILMILYGIPFVAERLTPLVPRDLETRLGEAVDSQFLSLTGAKTCSGIQGRRAFAKLMQKINGGHPVEAEVLSLDMVNAVTLPGDKVYLFKGMLEKAESVDEIAGVMAHEVGHARHRHGLETLIQTGGTSYLLGLLFGDITGSTAVIFAAQSLLDASHSRDAETEADDFAVEAMTKLGRSPVPLGEFLKRLTGDQTATILDSHPVSSERLARIRQSDVKTTGPALLTDAEWDALKDICKS